MYTRVIYLLYNGSHYDVFMKADKEGREIGLFEVGDKAVRNEVVAIANEIIRKNKTIDTRLFKIKCNDCYSVFQSDGEAVNHLKSSGHSNFHQIRNDYNHTT